MGGFGSFLVLVCTAFIREQLMILEKAEACLPATSKADMPCGFNFKKPRERHAEETVILHYC